MATTIDSGSRARSVRRRASKPAAAGRPTIAGEPTPAGKSARLAAARVSRASLGLGALGLAACSLVLLRVLGSWHVSATSGSHSINLLGQRVSYPVANAAAIVILLLALLGFLALTMTMVAGARELLAVRRFSRELARRSQYRLGHAHVIDEPRPAAFCAGLLRPRVYVSSATVELLDEGALEAVLEHERQHARRRDPLRLAACRVIARGLFFVPGLNKLSGHYRALAELAADEAAVRSDGSNRSALARAMLGFAGGEQSAGGIDPDRVDYLLGHPPSWRFPWLVCIASAASIALLIGVILLVGAAASGRATLAPPFLSRQPCVLVLALIPGIICAVAVRLRTRL
jgi:BlaR1 peptidase M56